MEITNEIKQKIQALVFKDREGRDCIALGNCRLDFKQTYLFFGFTKKTVKLAWINGRDNINVQGKVEDRGNYYALYTDGWSYIEHLPKEAVADVN